MNHPNARTTLHQQLARPAVAALLLGLALLVSAGGSPGIAAAAPATPEFKADRAETERFIAYESSIQLTPEQEKVRVAALSKLRAPCCKEFTADTCCCRCNMARATWGLAKHLIVNEGADAERVRTAVAAWHLAINPEGFSGDVCSTGGCGRSFEHNGCGGMTDKLVF